MKDIEQRKAQEGKVMRNIDLIPGFCTAAIRRTEELPEGTLIHSSVPVVIELGAKNFLFFSYRGGTILVCFLGRRLRGENIFKTVRKGLPTRLLVRGDISGSCRENDGIALEEIIFRSKRLLFSSEK